LGIEETAAPPVWEAKFLEFAQRFAPWTLVQPELAPLAERARDLFLAGARAFAEIAEVESRNTLLYRRKVLREERSKKTASFGIKTDLLDSEVQYRKGKELMEAGRYKEAVQYLEFASDCDPQNSVYGAELAYCRFLHTDALAGRAARDLAEILRRDPGAGLAAYYAGEIHRHLRNWDEAEELLRRAIKAMSPDRRPIEALKVLAAERKR
jgi:tetratricopeptide (TPR) repeat protein